MIGSLSVCVDVADDQEAVSFAVGAPNVCVGVVRPLRLVIRPLLDVPLIVMDLPEQGTSEISPSF